MSKAQRVRDETERKAAKFRARAVVLEQKVEKKRRKLEDVRLEHNKAKQEIERLHLAIDMYGKLPPTV
jgi:chromosome segregation ATPase